MITEKLIKWYRQNERNLPWRSTKDPFKIWLSEVILQQTRVEQGLDYYLKFVKRFETVFDLASASEDEVLKMWQGLGYYSRARNLQFAAKQIVGEHGGKFPDTKAKLLTLKGIGDYTASAIASIAFNQAEAVVDGNVLRFLSRLYAIEEPIDKSAGKNRVAEIANSLIDKEQPGEFNQALMEFGAIYCKPKNPDCQNCIFVNNCLAFEKKLVAKLPSKSGKMKQRVRYFYYIIAQDKSGYIYISKREGNDIWKGLYEFPLIEVPKQLEADELFRMKEFETLFAAGFQVLSVSEVYKHQLSHQKIVAQFVKMEIEEHLPSDRLMRVHKTEFDRYAVPRLLGIYLDKYGV